MGIRDFFPQASEGGKMTPVAYVSKWTDKVFYVGKTLHNNQEVYFAAADGTQPADGLIFPNYSEVRSWLIDNGFNRK